MTAVLERPLAAPPRMRRDRRRWAWGLGAAAVLVWSLAGAGLFSGDVLNPGGTAQFGRFAAAALDPAVDAAFLGLLARSALVTVAYAAAGTALALVALHGMPTRRAARVASPWHGRPTRRRGA